MTSLPLIPENAPFTTEQRAWLNGFLAGVLNRGQAPAGLPGAVAPPSQRPLLIAFGSQSGNAESLAKRLAREAAGRGFAARAAGLDSLQPPDLLREQNVLLITSTWGEGDMPDNAVSFWNSLNQNGSSPKLDGVRYSVLALGDKNYGDTFCLAGRKLDERLEQLGAVRVAPRVDCDVEFDDLAKGWSTGAFAALLDGAAGAPTPVSVGAVVIEEETPETSSRFNKKNPFPAPLLANIRLNGDSSTKDTRHIAFSIAGSGLDYEVGDALGVYVQNCPEVVEAVIGMHGFDGNAEVTVADRGGMTLREALLTHFEIRHLLGDTPNAGVAAAEFVGSLRKLQPRLYSIASSPKAHPDEVHLCVGAVRYHAAGIAHKGVASTFLADRLPLGETTGIFFHSANHFRLPVDRTRPIIMVGPGTGIAPFRAFLEEREATGAPGKNWLFFGDQRRISDFLYHDQIIDWVRKGLLNRLDTAFSRDQDEKIYVQHRMEMAAAELWQWLEEGAHFYVCGDAKRMAKDVDAALHTIIQTAGGKTADEATAYVADMKKNKRYQRDVY